MTSVELMVMNVMKHTIGERKMFLFLCKSMQIPSLFNLVFIRDVSFSAKSSACIIIAITDYIHSSAFLFLRNISPELIVFSKEQIEQKLTEKPEVKPN